MIEKHVEEFLTHEASAINDPVLDRAHAFAAEKEAEGYKTHIGIRCRVAPSKKLGRRGTWAIRVHYWTPEAAV